MTLPFSAPADRFFSTDYVHARTRFLEAAQRATALHQAFSHPQSDDLFCDAVIVPHRSPYALITLSGTHGVEGYCGSAIQSAVLHYNEYLACHPMFQIHIHGLNAWGMRHFSRTDEQHVDINRSIIDFTSVLPVNQLYPMVHEHLCFQDWDERTIARFWDFQETFIRTHGLTGWNRAFSGGQYDYPDGVMYGGTAPGWSQRVLQRIAGLIPEFVTTLIVLDFHTGVGQFGEALILVKQLTPIELAIRLPSVLSQRRSLIFDAHNLPLSTHNFSGLVLEAFTRLPQRCIPLVVEYGTYPARQMIEAILYDRWLAWSSQDTAALRQSLLEQYCPSDPAWRDRVLGHAWMLLDMIGKDLAEPER
ncbi:MAG TPA: DUF2817 domain-containing protein [Herpetosiphonaceae bacterium]